jgi:aldehyde:ferredoxin oxidoreductase
MAVIYRINMSDRTVRTEEADQTCRRLGGRGLTSTMLAAEVPPDCHPLSAENKLIFAPGILTGTAAPCSGRLSVGAKSPLTGTIKESNAGGTAAIAMATLGIKAIVLEGKPTEKTLYRLVIGHDGVKIEEADDLAGLGNYDTVAKEFERFGDKVTCMSIGPAGEMFAAAATIAVTDMENRPTRHCGRGGLGAVMGSKGVKTIILDPAGGARPKPADPERFKAAARKFAKALKNNPISGEGLPTFGTNSLADVMDQAGGFPTRNFSQGQFEGIEKINAQRQYDLITERKGVIAHACHPGCTIKCSRIYMDKDGKYLTKGPEYETIWAHGPNCGIDDLDAIAQMDRIDDDLGLDTIETGVTIGVAMEAGILPFGDAEGAIGLLEEVRKRTPLGRLVAAGADVLGKAYGVERIPHGRLHDRRQHPGRRRQRRSAQARRPGRAKPHAPNRHRRNRRLGPLPVRGVRHAGRSDRDGSGLRDARRVVRRALHGRGLHRNGGGNHRSGTSIQHRRRLRPRRRPAPPLLQDRTTRPAQRHVHRPRRRVGQGISVGPSLARRVAGVERSEPPDR